MNMKLVRWLNGAPYLALLVILIIVPLFLNNLYYVGSITLILINVLLTCSLWLILTTGQVSLCHAGFASIGAYISAALVMSYGFSFWPSLFIAMAITGIIAGIFGYITLRIKGVYFMLASLALGEIIVIVFGMLEHPFGGLAGIMNIPKPDPIAIPGIPVIEFASIPALYYLVLAFVVLSVTTMGRLSKSQIGLVFLSISQADVRAEHIGINIMKYKVMAFVIGSMFAGLAGVLYCFCVGSILPSSFSVIESIYALVCISVGGGAGIAGPVLGAAALGVLSLVLRPIKEFEPILYGMLVIAFVLFFKGGLLRAVQTLGHELSWWIGRKKYESQD